MKHSYVLMSWTFFAMFAGCDSGQKSDKTAAAEEPGIQMTTTRVEASALPPELLSIVADAVPGIQIEGAERKERDGRVYYDVEGRRPDGSEVEFDVLREEGGYKIVEIQRDIAWSEAPDEARSAAAASERAFEPVRVIESKQTDGSVIYELFAEGAPEKPSLEVRVADGNAEVLTEEWIH